MGARAVYGIVVREWQRFLRQRGRVLSSLARPFVWLIFAGAGFAAVFAGRDAIDYRVYMAAGMRSIENFAGVMNFVVFPMLFLSGALYPIGHLGPVLHVLTYLNPLAYGVDLLKHALLAPWTGAGYGGELRVTLDVVALVGFAVVGLAGATPLLARERGVTRAAFRQRA